MSHSSAVEERSPERPRNQRRRLSLRRRFLFSVFSTALLFASLELILAVLGVQPVSNRRDAYVGFAGSVPLFTKSGDLYSTTPLKLSYFNQQSFSAKKSRGTRRVFCLGGSTTFGHPYEDPTSFCGWLREMLHEVEPDGSWEVINCGGVSYASYRVALLMNELIEYEPDLFIVYTGHNEFLEERSYGNLREAGLVEMAGRSVSRLRISGVIDDFLGGLSSHDKTTSRLAAEVDVILDHTDGPETYRRDPELRRGVVAHFRESLLRIIQLAQGSGAKVILVKPESNLKDFSPFKSESTLSFGESLRWEKLIRDAREARKTGQTEVAVELLLLACSLDPHHADGLFQAASALFEAGRIEEAEQYSLNARDEDVCNLRAPREITESIPIVAESRNVKVVNFQKIIAQRCLQIHGHMLPGDECFLDHVHPTVDANGDLGVALFKTMQEMELVPPQHSPEQIHERVRHRVTSSISKEEQALALTRVAQVLAWAGKDQEGLRSAKQAVELCPESSAVVSQYGRMLEKNGQTEDAFIQYQAAVRLDSSDSLALSRLAAAFFMKDSIKEARDHWGTAIANTPDSAPLSFRVELHVRVGDCHALLGDREAARKEYLIASRLDPASPLVAERLRR